MIREENPFEKFGKETREIQFIAEPIRLSKNTYQINYKVITRQLTGNIKDNQTYLAVITVKVLQPTDDDIKDNPLGIYITEFDMKQVDKNVYTEEEKK
jgi:type IV secretion system protein VirB5